MTQELIIAAGCILSGTIGFLAAALLTHGKAREAERRAWRQSASLHRSRRLQDLRDNTRLF